MSEPTITVNLKISPLALQLIVDALKVYQTAARSMATDSVESQMPNPNLGSNVHGYNEFEVIADRANDLLKQIGMY